MKPLKLLIAGTHSGAGKTTVSLALMAAFRARGRQVQPFKAGPDFIDPGHHRLACGRESRNLDSWMLGAELNRQIFEEASRDADIAIIEGMMGLFDGASPISDQGSSAEIAKQIGAPVLLVIDGSAMARSAAAMVSGYANFDSDLEILGVIFNRIRSERHFRLLQEAVESVTGIQVVGYLPPDENITISDRHLGLRTAIESEDRTLYRTLGELAEKTIKLNVIEELAQVTHGKNVSKFPRRELSSACNGAKIKIGVAYDPAFCFYYQDNLELLQAAGADIIHFSPINDSVLPDVDMLYLGGGYPEIYAEALHKNLTMRRSIHAFAMNGNVIFAECGGLMYLTQTITDFEGRTFEMAGVFPGRVIMDRKRLTLGYRDVQFTKSCILGKAGMHIRGHEFHYSSFSPTGVVKYACQWTDACSSKHGHDGLVSWNVLALYTHVYFGSQPAVPQHLVQRVRDNKAVFHE